MKNVVKLTADELATVLDTIEATAIVQTLRETANADAVKNLNSINWQGVFSALFEMFDNGLTAMGIEIAEDAEDAEAIEEEEEDEEEEWTPCDDCYHPYACDKCEYADDDDDEEEADPIAKMLFTYDGKITISQKNAMEITHQMAELIEKQGDGLTASQKTIWLHDALTALAKDYGIEYVLDV